MAEQVLPHRLSQSLGTLAIRKGTLDGLALFTWDVIPDCTDNRCKATLLCDFTRKGRCTVMVQYMKGTSEMLFRSFGDVLDEPTFYRVGMHLMPMYRTLARLKIEELGVKNIITTSDTGRKQANPIYKELRDTIKLIDGLWNSLGLTKYAVVEIPDDLPMEDTPVDSHGHKKMLTKEQEALLVKSGKKRKLVRRKK